MNTLPSRNRSRQLLAAGLLAIAIAGGCGDGSDLDPGDDEAAPAYTLTIAVDGSGRLGALQFEMTHLGNSGGFIGREVQIDCRPLADGIVAGNYVGERVAKIGFISLAGVRMPAPLLECGFRTREALDASSFLFEVTDASDTNSNPLDPPPQVVLSRVVRR